jgi:dihydrofolate reductase
MTKLEPLALVVAMGPDRVIGLDGGLPWHFSEDLRHFRSVTTGHAIIMGRKTWDSIGRPLPGRRNIVVTRQEGLEIDGCEVVHSLGAALQLAREHDPEPRIIGGGALYREALPLATRLYVTEVACPVDGDTFFPAIDPSEWRESERRQGDSEELVFVTMDRA